MFQLLKHTDRKSLFWEEGEESKRTNYDIGTTFPRERFGTITAAAI
jgi:hypothetical protein